MSEQSSIPGAGSLVSNQYLGETSDEPVGETPEQGFARVAGTQAPAPGPNRSQDVRPDREADGRSPADVFGDSPGDTHRAFTVKPGDNLSPEDHFAAHAAAQERAEKGR
jgi:hypothetical protein